MLVKTVDIASGRSMTAMEVEPGMLPRIGEQIDVGAEDFTWHVQQVIWEDHPGMLTPTLYLLASKHRQRLNPSES